VLAGIGVEILVKQLPTVLGLPGGGTTTIGRLRAVVDQIGKFNGWAFGIAAVVLAIVIVAEKVDHRIPGALIGVVGATAVVAAAGLKGHGVKVVGSVKAGLPSFGLPSTSLHQLGSIMAMVVTVAFLCIVQTSATARSAGAAQAKPEDFNMDLVAVGAGSLLAGLAGSFTVDSSPPRTAVVTSAGGKSQATSLVAAGAVVVVLAFATGLLKDMPEATLGAVLVFVASRLFHVQELLKVLSFGWFEFALLLITVVVVVFVGVEQGVVAAALLALAARTRLAARPQDAVLGREPGTDHWIQTDIGRPTEQVPGVLVYLIYAPVWYANASHVVERIKNAVAAAPSSVHSLVIDANAISDVDYTGARTLGQLISELHSQEVQVGVARASHTVHHDLKHAGLLQEIGTEHVFASVEEAVSTMAAAKASAGASGPPQPAPK
jgi:MFS superfamily sulfate permease-like transporter